MIYLKYIFGHHINNRIDAGNFYFTNIDHNMHTRNYLLTQPLSKLTQPRFLASSSHNLKLVYYPTNLKNHYNIPYSGKSQCCFIEPDINTL